MYRGKNNSVRPCGEPIIFEPISTKKYSPQGRIIFLLPPVFPKKLYENFQLAVKNKFGSMERGFGIFDK